MQGLSSSAVATGIAIWPASRQQKFCLYRKITKCRTYSYNFIPQGQNNGYAIQIVFPTCAGDIAEGEKGVVAPLQPENLNGRRSLEQV